MTGAAEARPAGRRLAALAALVGLCLLLFFGGLGRPAIWDTDEGKHTTTAKAMVESGDWITPRFNGKPFYDKPPLFFWLVALSFSVLGFTELAARLPAAMLGLATVLVTYGMGRRLVGARAAFLGAIVLATTIEFVALSRVVVHDITLVLCVTVSLLAVERALTSEAARRRAWLVLAYTAMGLGVVAKGPVGLVIPASVIVAWLLAQRDVGALRRMMPIGGALIVLLIALPWYVAVSLRDPQYLSYFLLEKNLGSFVSRTSRHPQPFYYYVPVLLLGFFPWSSFLPLTLGRLLRHRARIDPRRLFLLVWACVVFVFFSAATSKLPTYILPLFPPLALLVGDAWPEGIESRGARRPLGLVISQLVLLAIVASAVPVYLLQAIRHPLYDPALHGPQLVALSAILVAPVVAGTILLWLRRYRALFAANAGLLVALVLYGVVFLLPVIDPYRSSRDIALELDRMLPAGEKMAFYHELRESALFYTGREALLLRTPEELEAHLERPGALCVVDGTRYHAVEHLADRFRVVERRANKIVIQATVGSTEGKLTSASTAPGPDPGSSGPSSPGRDSSATADPD